MVHSDDLAGTVSLPQLGGGACALNVLFKNLKTASPTLRGDDDVVYLVCMLQEDDQAVWIATVDTRSKSVGEVVPFSAEGSGIYDPTFIPCVLSKYLGANSAQSIRDVTFSCGYIKCVEFEELVKLKPTTVPPVVDPSDMDELLDTELAISPPQEEEEEVYDVVGWRLITWYRELTWNRWRKRSLVHSDDLGTVSLPQLGGGACALNVLFKNLKTASPTLRADDDVVYLVSMLDENDQTTWIVTVDTRTKSVGEVMPFSAEPSRIYDPSFIPCVLTKYLDTKSDGARGGNRNASHVPLSRNFSESKKQRRQHLPKAELEEQQPLPRLLQHSSGR
ncbi:hypothetical protein ACQ4PT_034644 [Festuca glaucescens]